MTTELVTLPGPCSASLAAQSIPVTQSWELVQTREKAQQATRIEKGNSENQTH